MTSTFLVVLRKELVDALRDRRTMLIVLLSSVAMGPLMLVLVSMIFADAEKLAESRQVQMAGATHAPTLRNFLERQALQVVQAPPDYEQQLRDSRLHEPVIVVAPDFERQLARGEPVPVEVISHGSNQRAAGGVGRAVRLLRAFNEEQRVLRLAAHGLWPGALVALEVQERDLAEVAARGAQLAFIIPFFVLSAVLYGAFGAALDTTAGERERGSLEPLMMTPASPLALTLGKWGAAASVGMLVALLSCASFLPGQWLLRNEWLSAMFRFGPQEALAFLALLLPLAGTFAGALMAVAIRCKTVKEAQANATVLMLAVNLTPLVQLFSRGGEAAWHLWVPGLAQITLMGRVLKGQAVGAADILIPLAVCLLVAAACVAWVAASLRRMAVK